MMMEIDGIGHRVAKEGCIKCLCIEKAAGACFSLKLGCAGQLPRISSYTRISLSPKSRFSRAVLINMPLMFTAPST